MFLDFIEIGTSDFDTELMNASPNKKGISIEPVKYYLDKLPNKPNVIKYNIAISDNDGSCRVYYMPEETIKKYKFPRWVRGCNRINEYHPTVMKLIKKKYPDINPVSLISSYKVKCETLYNFLKNKNIYGIYYLKIDTEGHDIVILNCFLDQIKSSKQYNLLPHKILFESNVLSNRKEVDNLIKKLEESGYHLIKRGTDTIVQLNVANIPYTNLNLPLFKLNNYTFSDIIDRINPNATLDSTIRYCKKKNYSGVTLIDNNYLLGNGYLIPKNGGECWINI
jgi:FkbM family methyltransferase